MLGDIKKTMTDDFRVINWMVSWLGDEKKADLYNKNE